MGNEVIPLKYDKITLRFYEGLARVKLNGKCGFINKSDIEVIPVIFDKILRFYFHEGLTTVKLNGKWGSIDKQGKVRIPLKYNKPLFFHSGFAVAKLGEKWGSIDKDDNWVIDYE
jgi:hypothetical protein